MIKQFYDICKQDNALGAWLCLVTSVVLIFVSFFTPPMWIIDGSVIAATGELFAFATLFKLPNLIQSIKDGKEIKLKRGETEVSVKSSKNEED